MFVQLGVKPLSEMETNAAGDSPVLQTEKFSYFLPACECEMNGKLKDDLVIIKEATTGYLDPVSQQAVGNFITYVIEVGVRPGSMNVQTRRRYSDFELFAAHLNRLYPYCVIPPIPDKQSFGEIITGYAMNKGKQDPVLIQHRIRLFQSFLKNIQSHPILRGDHVFHLFVSAGAEWNDVMTSSASRMPVSLQTAQPAKKGKVPDPLFVKLENMTAAYKSGIKSIDQGQRRLIKKLKDESATLNDLGASFNAFSLEYAALQAQLELIGQSADAEVVDLHALIRHHEQLSDDLKEVILYCDSITKCLSNHAAKRLDLEDYNDQINAKKNVLMQLESSVKVNDDGDARHEQIRKTRHLIEQLEYSKKQKFAEMNEYTTKTIKDIERAYNHFGLIWKTSLRSLAECQCKWHESSIESWKKE